MSMLSAQCDELREVAYKVDEYQMGRERVPLKTAAIMREAADTIWQLRDDLQRANAENARLRSELEAVGIAAYLYGRDDLKAENTKLREEIEAAKHDLSLFSGDLVASKAENARLRELAAILCHCMQVHASCDECRINGHKGELARDPLCACDSLHEMLRELGIEGFEVDG